MAEIRHCADQATRELGQKFCRYRRSGDQAQRRSPSWLAGPVGDGSIGTAALHRWLDLARDDVGGDGNIDDPLVEGITLGTAVP